MSFEELVHLSQLRIYVCRVICSAFPSPFWRLQCLRGRPSPSWLGSFVSSLSLPFSSLQVCPVYWPFQRTSCWFHQFSRLLFCVEFHGLLLLSLLFPSLCLLWFYFALLFLDSWGGSLDYGSKTFPLVLIHLVSAINFSLHCISESHRFWHVVFSFSFSSMYLYFPKTSSLAYGYLKVHYLVCKYLEIFPVKFLLLLNFYSVKFDFIVVGECTLCISILKMY